MGTIKDLIDLTTQLVNSVKDRKIASELNAIQTLILELQKEQAGLHESNIELREEKLSYKEKIQKLEAEIEKLKTLPISVPNDIPFCPNCSTASKPFYMRPVPVDFIQMLDATHECPKCKYNTKIKPFNRNLR